MAKVWCSLHYDFRFYCEAYKTKQPASQVGHVGFLCKLISTSLVLPGLVCRSSFKGCMERALRFSVQRNSLVEITMWGKCLAKGLCVRRKRGLHKFKGTCVNTCSVHSCTVSNLYKKVRRGTSGSMDVRTRCSSV